MRAPRMWDVERGPRASLGRQKAHGDGLVGVFEASSVVAVQSLRGIVGHAPAALTDTLRYKITCSLFFVRKITLG